MTKLVGGGGKRNVNGHSNRENSMCICKGPVATGMRGMGLEGGGWESGRIHRPNPQGPGGHAKDMRLELVADGGRRGKRDTASWAHQKEEEELKTS